MLSRGSTSSGAQALVGIGSTSLNHVLELLVAAQREILDTQRDMIQENATQGHAIATADDCALIQRYQENSLGLLNAAAEGLVQVIMHWSPSLEGSAQPRFAWPMLGALQEGDRSPVAPSSSLLVATLAEVDALETSGRQHASQSRIYQFLFRWTLAKFRTTLRAYKQLEADSATRTTSVEEISDAIKVRSVLLIERVHRVQQSAMQGLLASTVRVSLVKYFGIWTAFRTHRQKVLQLNNLTSRRAQADTLFRTFSMWHRGKLCSRIADLELQLEASKDAGEQNEAALEVKWLMERKHLEAELSRVSVALQQSTAQVSSLEDDVMRAQRLVEELTDQLGTSSRSVGVSSLFKQHQTRQLEEVFQRRIDSLEAELEECKRHNERVLSQTNAWVGGVVIPTVNSILEGALHRGDVHHTFLLGAFVEGLQQRLKPASPAWSTSQDDVSISSSMDSVDRGELMLKLSQLTQEVEVLRAEKTTLKWSQPTHQYFSPLMRSASFDNIPRVSSMGGEDPQQTLLEEQLRRTKRRLASLLGAKTKCLLAASCLRRWMVNSQSNRQKDELSAMERAHRHWVQNSVEERDKALVALDEQIQDDHHRIQVAMSVSRVTHGDGSPSPLRNLSIDGGAMSDGGGGSPILPQNLRRWSVGYRSPGGAARLGLEAPDKAEALSAAANPTSDATTETEHPQDLVALENEELHTALSVSHEREQGLMGRLEDALRQLEEERIASSESRLLAQTQEDRLVVTYAHLCENEVVAEENAIRQHLEYNEQRARHHSLQSLQSTLLSKSLLARDDALTECTKADSRHHLQACKAADAMSNTLDITTMRRYWDVWSQILMLRRFETMSDQDRRAFEATVREREQSLTAHFRALMAEQSSRSEKQHRALVSSHAQEVEHLKRQLEREHRVLVDHTEESHRREVESKQIVRQLRNDAVTGTLLASRLGIEVVEYCASSAFRAWHCFAERRRAQRNVHERGAIEVFLALATKWHGVVVARCVEDMSRSVFDKWTSFLQLQYSVFRGVEQSLRCEIEQKNDILQQNAIELADLKQRVAVLHLETTDVLRPRIAAAEAALKERDAKIESDIERCREETTASLEARFQQERSAASREHQQFCDELRESEALRNQELLQMQRDAYEQKVQRLLATSQQATCADAGQVIADAVATERGLMIELQSKLLGQFRTTLHEHHALEATQSMTVRHVMQLLDDRSSTVRAYVADIHRDAAALRARAVKTMEREQVRTATRWMMHLGDAALNVTAGVRGSFAEYRAEFLDLAARQCREAHLILAADFSGIRHEFDSERQELVAYGRFLEESTTDLQRQLAELREVRTADQLRSDINLRAMQEAHATSAATEREGHEQLLRMLRAEHADAIEHMSIQFAHLQRTHSDLKEECSRKQRQWAHELEDLQREQTRTIADLMERNKTEHSAAEHLLSQARHDATELKQSLEEEHRIALENEHKQSESALRHLKSSLETQRQRTDASVLQATVAMQYLESQHRSSTQELESSHFHDFEHLRSECHLRIREEVSLEIEHRLENMTSSQQGALSAHLQALERKLDERQRDHDEAITVLRETHALQLQALHQQSDHDIDRLQNELKSVNAAQLKIVPAVSSRENRMLLGMEEDARDFIYKFAALHRLFALAPSQYMSRASHIFGALEQRTRSLITTLAVGERQTITACAEATLSVARDHETKIHALEASHEGNLNALATTLLDESRIAIARGTSYERAVGRQTTVTKGLRVLRNASLCHLAQRTIYKWRLWAMIRAFRSDYRVIRDERNQYASENKRFRLIVEQAFEAHKSRAQSSATAHLDAHDSPTLLSPLSDDATSMQLKHHLSPHSTVNSSAVRERAASTAVDSLIDEVDDLIERGKQLRLNQPSHQHTETF